jgi:hypothetical protein
VWTRFESFLACLDSKNYDSARRELEILRGRPDLPGEVLQNYEKLLQIRLMQERNKKTNSYNLESNNSNKHHLDLKPEDLDQIHEHAGQIFQAGDHISALVLFEHLMEMRPQSQEFVRSRDKALQAVSKATGLHPLINTAKTTRRGKALRLLHTLLATGFSKENLVRSIESLPVAKDRFALQANLAAGSDIRAWETFVNGLLGEYGLRGLTLKEPGFSPTVMHNISFLVNRETPVDRGLVTICISAHNSAATLPYAIESILRQDYQNFELLVLDDASTDSTAEAAESYAEQDSRIITIRNKKNRGTYWNRNLALSRAKGEFFTVLDADDLCHPERIPLQLEFLHQNPAVMGVFGLWFRLEAEGRMTYRNSWGGVIVHEAVATLIFRRHEVTSRIGYYDPVKIASDTEYLERIKRVFGQESIQQIRRPLSIALAHTNSLTAARGTGIDNYFGLSKPRQDYRNSWNKWHKAATPEQLFIPLPKGDYARPFPAPEEIVVK